MDGRKERPPIRRGEIYFVNASRRATGSEQHGGRPAVIVSNNDGNRTGQTVEVVWLTTQDKNHMPTHVLIKSAPKHSMALAEQITTVAVERLNRCMGRVTEEEMQCLETAMLWSLGIHFQVSRGPVAEEGQEAGSEQDKAQK